MSSPKVSDFSPGYPDLISKEQTFFPSKEALFQAFLSPCNLPRPVGYQVRFWHGATQKVIEVKADLDGCIFAVEHRSSKFIKEIRSLFCSLHLRLWFPQYNFKRNYYVPSSRCRDYAEAVPRKGWLSLVDPSLFSKCEEDWDRMGMTLSAADFREFV